MSWNNGKETKIFKAWLAEQIAYWRKHGMCEQCIDIMVEYEKEQFNNRRNFAENIEITSLYATDEKGEEYLIKHDSLLCEDNVCAEPFEFGFNDPRLNKIWFCIKDEIDITIFKMLSQGYKQSEIARALKMSEKAISKRVEKMRKNFL